jgi:hypothetical protein
LVKPLDPAELSRALSSVEQRSETVALPVVSVRAASA